MTTKYSRFEIVFPAIFATLCLLCISLLLPDSAAAQTARQLQKQINQLEKQLGAVQRQVFNGDSKYFPKQGGSIDRAAADQTVQMDQLEDKMRRMTGELERLNFENQRLKTLLEELQARSEYRLTALEGGPALLEESDENTLSEGLAEGADVGAATAPVEETAEANPVESITPETPALADAPASGLRPDEIAGGDIDAEVPAEEEVAAITPPDPQESFDMAFNQMRQLQYDAAERSFVTFLTDFPEHELASNAQYWLGRVYIVQKDPARAADAFLNSYRNYPDGNKAPESLLGLAATLRQMNKAPEACTALDLLKGKYPDIGPDLQRGLDSERSRSGCS